MLASASLGLLAGLTTTTVSSVRQAFHSMGPLPNPQGDEMDENDDGECVGFVRGYVGCKSASLFQQVGRTGSLGSAAHRERGRSSWRRIP